MGNSLKTVYLSAPDVGELEELAIVRAVQSGWVAPLGPEVDAFEREIASRVGVSNAVALNSGTSALHLGLLSLGVSAGDTVVTATMTFAATANAISYTGATPFFIDCEPATANIDSELLVSGLLRLRGEGKKVAAIVPVDMLGKAVDYTRVTKIAKDFGVPILADAAESLGAHHNGKAAGSFGSASVLSFNGNKIMTTSGGGMLLTNDADLAGRVRYLSTQSRQPVPHYEHTDIGYNYRLSNLLAALGRAQLQRLDGMIERRRNLRQRYKEFFRDISGVEILGTENDDEDNAWLTAIQIDTSITGWSPEELANALAVESIESRPIWKPMHLQPVFERFDGEISGASQKLFETCITLPSGSALTNEEINRVFSTISNFLAQK